MLNALNGCGLKEFPIESNGDCLYSSISHQLFSTIEHHLKIRFRSVDWIWENRERLAEFIDKKRFSNVKNYCDEMKKHQAWGDLLTLYVVAELYVTRIIVISSVGGNNYITEHLPISHPERTIILFQYSEQHYGSLLPL
jgi:hypothetical protein